VFSIPGSIRLWITSCILLGGSLLLHTLQHGEAVVARQPLSDIPETLGAWHGESHPLQPQVLQILNVTDYTNRLYVEPDGKPVQLYIGYYANQRTGDTIHSPKNCLPGAGWDPIQSGYTTITLNDGRQVTINEYVIQQDLNKQMVFYWYQTQGRVIASEYSAKFWMVSDALTRNRTDGALVRVITPMNDSEEVAKARLTQFTQALFPHLQGILPN
jgi:EpsI family protein